MSAHRLSTNLTIISLGCQSCTRIIYRLYRGCGVQGLLEEIQSVQEEIDRLQANFTEDMAANAVDSDMADRLAMQSSLAVLAERMATIHMKALGKQQLLEVQALLLERFKLELCFYITAIARMQSFDY